jgi:hypothetical protein
MIFLGVISDTEQYRRGRRYKFHPLTSYQTNLLLVRGELRSVLDCNHVDVNARRGWIFFWRFLWKEIPKFDNTWVLLHIGLPTLCYMLIYFVVQLRIIF